MVLSWHNSGCLSCYLCIVISQDGATPLWMASQNGHSSIVDLLLRHGGDPNIADEVSSTSTTVLYSTKSGSLHVSQ